MPSPSKLPSINVDFESTDTVANFFERTKRAGRAPLRYQMDKRNSRRSLFLWLAKVHGEFFLCDDFVTEESGVQPYGFCEPVEAHTSIGAVMSMYDQWYKIKKRMRLEQRRRARLAIRERNFTVSVQRSAAPTRP